ncbi:MAG: F0F1 ATP synthase subunit alpha [Candidatus Ryanbacteria bacterium RIFCSPLOWO2_01_FULL_48_26]|uniref:ATP synthase subunit alpha n=1 Tax=Candidatus Ryanbacteria bacterium RIFCSPLOWO2_01_FULL_48_26 TaxID=1802126 RepID=A0A1G2GVC6_9BACT|nr:MAG: F0F1 ATP synthase subunit alpha [Candidatus Ryanbacteria bacterium RIFCSPLOWO2_01_FULL_48_26]
MSYEIIEKLKKEIEGYKDTGEWEEIGRVIEVGDGVARISGLRGVQAQEIITIETGETPVSALALNIEEETVGALILGEEKFIKSGDTAKTTGQVLSIEVGDELLGRVVNPLGEALDGLGQIYSAGGGSSSGGKNKKESKRFPLEKKAPSVVSREAVNEAVHTGIKSIDAMIPIGRGQRELIIGDRQTGKTAVAIDVILNQKNETVRRPICIYVAIGQKESKTAKLVATLKEKGALEYSVIVDASASSPAALWYLAPYAGCAIGEYFMSKGLDAVIIYDDLTKHAQAYRQISLLLGRPPGREAFPGDVFYLHSRLLERAAKLNKENGGGSLTALPIIETQLGDISAYIPTNVISITDGQIFLESDLFHQGIRPAINVGLSVSRVGSAAQTKAMKKVAGKLRLELAQFRELQAFVQFASDVDEATREKIKRGGILTEILKQDDLQPVPFEKQVVVIYAALNGYFNDVHKEQIKGTGERLLDHLEKTHGDSIFKPIREKRELTPDMETKIKEALSNFDFVK